MDDITSMQEALRLARRARPFMPFTMILDTGERLPVGQPLWFGFTDEQVNVWVPKEGLKRFAFRRLKAIEGASSQSAA
jgi:hypothetical protein